MAIQDHGLYRYKGLHHSYKRAAAHGGGGAAMFVCAGDRFLLTKKKHAREQQRLPSGGAAGPVGSRSLATEMKKSRKKRTPGQAIGACRRRAAWTTSRL